MSETNNASKVERRAIKTEVRVVFEGNASKIVGYASVFYDKNDEGTEFEIFDGFVERIMPGAFDRAIRERDDVRALFNHAPDNMLGRTEPGTLRLSVDRRGLRYEIDLGNTIIAKDVAEHIKRGDVTGSSFSFTVTDQETRTEDEIDIREITGVKLFDVGPVTYPAYEATTTDTRAMGRAMGMELRSMVAGKRVDRKALAERLKKHNIRQEVRKKKRSEGF